MFQVCLGLLFVANAMVLINVSVYDTESCQTLLPWTILQSDDDRLTVATFFERVSSERQWWHEAAIISLLFVKIDCAAKD